MIDRQILVKLLHVQDLPTLPEVMTEILDTIADEASSAGDLTALLEKDHAISARVLRLANSAFYGLRTRVDSIRRAVVVIGFDAVRHLALATTVFDALASRRQFALVPEDFWMHSLGAAKAAQLLTKQYCRQASHDGCFTAGLLHDLGKYVLALVLKAEYVNVVAAARSDGCVLKDQELLQLKTTNAEVGQWLAEKWRFPTMISDAIGYRYRLSRYTGDYRVDVAVTAAADEVSRIAEFGIAGDFNPAGVDLEILNILGISDDDVQGIVYELDKVRDETSQFLSILKEA